MNIIILKLKNSVFSIQCPSLVSKVLVLLNMSRMSQTYMQVGISIVW